MEEYFSNDSPTKPQIRLATPEHQETEDDNEPITIKVIKPSPHTSSADLKKSPESQPLLSKSTGSDNDSKQESSV